LRRAQNFSTIEDCRGGFLRAVTLKTGQCARAAIWGGTDLHKAQWQEFTCERRGDKLMARNEDGSSNWLTDIDAPSPTVLLLQFQGKQLKAGGLVNDETKRSQCRQVFLPAGPIS